MNFDEAILTICELGKEKEAIIILLQNLSSKSENLYDSYRNAKARLSAIKKINAIRSKNEAIAALCEEE